MLCKSCGFEIWFEEQRVEFCPECGSKDLKLEIGPEVIPQAISVNSSRLDSSKSSELFKVFQSAKTPRHGYYRRSGTGMSNKTTIGIVLGIIGIIMCFIGIAIIRSYHWVSLL